MISLSFSLMLEQEVMHERYLNPSVLVIFGKISLLSGL